MRWSRESLLGWDVIGGGLLLWAIVGVDHAYRLSTAGADASSYYGMFWLGLAPVWVWLAFTALLKGLHFGVLHLLVLAVASWFPKFLRNPGFPLYHDEVAHTRSVTDLLTTGEFFQRNPIIPVLGEFPGLHALTGAIARLADAAPVWAGTLLLALAHVVALAAMQVIGRELVGTARAGAVAALVYATNPNVLYFDNQFSYESLGVVLFLATLALAVLAQQARLRRREAGPQWWAYATLAVMVAGACLVTHALSTLYLLFVLLLVTAAHAAARRGRGVHRAVRGWAVVAGSVAVLAVLWCLVVARDTFAYLAPYPVKAFQQLTQAARGGGGSRTLFVGSVQPAYERILSFAAQLGLAAAFVALAVLLWRFRRRWRLHPTLVAMLGLGAIYFPSALFILAPKGAEGARRSWAFLYVGVAVALALLVELATRRVRPRRSVRPRAPHGLGRGIAAVLGSLVLLIGNVSAGLNDPYRFPGEYRYGSDTRDRTPETRAMAEAFARLADEGKVATDRYTALALVGAGPVDPGIFSEGFRGPDLFTKPGDPDPALAAMLEHADYRYVVVDRRSAHLVPLAGWYFAPVEPPAGMAGEPLSASTLARFDDVRWATPVLTTDHYAVYRLQPELMPR